jgi:hypothetical protein
LNSGPGVYTEPTDTPDFWKLFSDTTKLSTSMLDNLLASTLL